MNPQQPLNDFQWNDETVKEFVRFIQDDKMKMDSLYGSIRHEEGKPPHEALVEWFKKEKGEKRSPEYEILSFQYKAGNIIYHNPGFNLDYCLARPEQYAIHSVKRLSDGEVFSVGDELAGFIHRDQKIDAFLPNYNGNAMWVSTNREQDYGCALKVAKKYEKPQPLFRTEDGVDIYEGGEVWVVGAWYNCFADTATKDKYEDQKSHCKHFSTKKAAEQYILLTKPVLSIADLKQAMEANYLQGFREFSSVDLYNEACRIAKSKL